MSEFDFHTYDRHHRRIELGTHELGPPWLGRWMTFTRAAIKHKGGDVQAATNLMEWVSSNPLFEDVHYQEFWIPVVPPQRDPSTNTEFYQRFDKKVTDDVSVSHLIVSTFSGIKISAL